MTVYNLVERFSESSKTSFSVKHNNEWLTAGRTLNDIVELFGEKEVKDAKIELEFCFGNNWIDIEIEI